MIFFLTELLTTFVLQDLLNENSIIITELRKRLNT